MMNSPAKKSSHGAPLPTTFALAALDNVTAIPLVAPVTLLVCDRIGVRPCHS